MSKKLSLRVRQPGYVFMSSDYSQQEPKLCAVVSGDQTMVEGFKQGKDAYAMIASVSFNKPYEQCLEFHPETHEYQPDGKARRSEAKSVLLGVLYGRSIPSIADQLYGKRDDMTDDQKQKAAQKVFDAVMNAFPGLRRFMISSQKACAKRGFTETVLGRRRHLPDMTLKPFEFKAMPGYVNPDIDPLDINTLQNKSEIPERIIKSLEEEFSKYKYFGQIARRTKELYQEKIKVINNKPKITDATRQVVNSIVQGSAADLTKMAVLELERDPEWKRIGGRLLVPVHDELCAEVPIDYAEEGAKLLSDCMCRAADFMPFAITCDVETSLRWYGMSYPCPYSKPQSLDDMSEDNVKWVQYMLTEMEYQLPVFNDKDGSKPRGDAARGVNGVVTDEFDAALSDYMKTRNIAYSNFISVIEQEVLYGIKSL